MMNQGIPTTAGASILAGLLLGSGCTTVVRENIISSINTGVGASITENPQTQLYEIKAGYIRTQFYSVPTGKVVKGSNITNSANCTPQVVSGIRMHTGIDNLILGMDVSENFAVGEIAVMSPAAVAMYLTAADKPATAQAAASAVAERKFATSDTAKRLRSWVNVTDSAERKRRQGVIKAWIPKDAKYNFADLMYRDDLESERERFLKDETQQESIPE